MIKFPSIISHFLCDSTQHTHTQYYPIHLCFVPKFQLEMVFVGTPTKSENKRTKIHEKKEKNSAHTHNQKKTVNFESEVFQIRFFCRGADGVFLLLFSLACLPACLHNCCFAFFTFSRTHMHTTLNVRWCVCVFSVCLLLTFDLIFQPPNTQHYAIDRCTYSRW